MNAFLVRLDYGLRDPSFMKLEPSSVPTESSEKSETNPKKRSVECYFELVGKEVVDKRPRLRLHVHKVEDGVKLGAPCSKLSGLKEIFSISQDPNAGAFVLTVVEALTHRFNVSLCLNDDILLVEQKSVYKLRHGDVIEGIYMENRCFKIMFLLREEGHSRKPQTSPLLSCPWIVLRNIMKFLTPMEMMTNIVPVCWKFFKLMKRGRIWSNLEFHVLFDGITSVPFGHLDDFCKVVSGYARKLSLEFKLDAGSEMSLPQNSLSLLFTQYDWSNLEMLDVSALETNEDAWISFLKKNGKALTSLKILMKKLHLGHADVYELAKAMYNTSYEKPMMKQFPDCLGSGVLLSLHAYDLPVQLDAKGWRLARKMGMFKNLESLSLNGEHFDNLPSVKEYGIFFPKLKELWLEDASPMKAVHHLLSMPSLEKLWIRNVRKQLRVEPGPRVLSAFNESPKDWLEKLRFVAAD
ncbi:unnamed protein product, partial [Notodromas monacha]